MYVCMYVCMYVSKQVSGQIIAKYCYCHNMTFSSTIIDIRISNKKQILLKVSHYNITGKLALSLLKYIFSSCFLN